MKKNVIILSAMLSSLFVFSQVGINTSTPESSLDVRGKNHLGAVTATDGVLVPRVNSLATAGTINGQLVYLIENSGSFTKGFHYWNGTAWTPFGAGTSVGDPTIDAWIDNPTNARVELRTLSDGITPRPSGNAFVAQDNGNVGIGIASPAAKLEIASGANNISGLKFTNINNSTPPNATAASLGVDNVGNVVVQSIAPLQTMFKSFSIDANTPTSSTIAIGSLEFRYNSTLCSSTPNITYIQVRSTSGTNNLGIMHGMYRTQQNFAGFVNTVAFTAGNTFTNLTALPLDCANDGHAQFTFYSYTDRTFYRVNIEVADGDNLGFGPLGYIFVEFQR